VVPSQHSYRPHLTLAYVKKGAMRELDDNQGFEGESYRVHQVLYSEPDRAARRLVNLKARCAMEAADWDESLHPRDHGKFAPKGGGESGVLANKFDLVHGASVTSTIRRLAKEGFTPRQIRNALHSYGIPVNPGTIGIQHRAGLAGEGSLASFTPEQLKDLRERGDKSWPVPPGVSKPSGGGSQPKPPPPPPAPKPLDKKEISERHELTKEECATVLKSKLDFRGKVSDKDKAEVNDAIDKGVGVFHGAAQRRLAYNVDKLVYAPHGSKEYNQTWGDATGSQKSIGFYQTQDKLVCCGVKGVDHFGGDQTYVWPHEFAHAVDRRTGDPDYSQLGSGSAPFYYYSQQQEFKDAWHADRQLGRTDHNGQRGWMRQYAWTNPQEGFACSVDHAFRYGKDSLRQCAPNMAALLEGKYRILA
jgi:hypothetical protein